MSWYDTLNYLAIGNPISKAVLSSGSAVLRGTGVMPKKVDGSAILQKPLTMLDLTNNNYHFIRLAGLCGTTAIVMGCYGRHHINLLKDSTEKADAKATFDNANRFHVLHSIVLLSMPLVRRPTLTGSLLITGGLLFCGPMYHRALTGDKTFLQLAPFGGICLFLAWASLMF